MAGISNNIIVRETPKFDLDSYVNNYEGRTRLERLHTIGLSSVVLAVEALRQAVAESKQGKNIQKYQDLVQCLASVSSEEPAAVLDAQWLDKRSREVKAETDRLEHELKGYKNNLIKESIRMGNEDLGAFYYETGDLPAAFKAFSRMREYCTLPKHICEMCLKLILVAVAQGNWMAVQQNVYKIQNLQLKKEDKEKVDPVMAPCVGLAHMASSQFRQAAAAFLDTDPAFITLEPTAGTIFNRQVLSPNDIAVYGALCALATMDRDQLAASVLANAKFRNFLELEPHLRRAIGAFCGSKYTQALEILESYRPDYLLDLYLQQHVQTLYSMVRRKSIVAYFEPFSQVSLASMASIFKVEESEMQAELVTLVKQGLLKARVDAVDCMLIATREDRRVASQIRALEVAQEQENSLRLRLLRINVIGAGMEVKASKSKTGVLSSNRGRAGG